jgi:hypothetical protein
MTRYQNFLRKVLNFLVRHTHLKVLVCLMFYSFPRRLL